MTEPKYIIDENGNKTDVLLPLDYYLELMEEIEDLKAIADRKDEDTISHDEVKVLFS